MTTNRIITRGMGSTRGANGRSGLITQGFGGRLFEKIKEEAFRVVRTGRSAAERLAKEVQEVVIWAKLIRINDEKPKNPIYGYTKVKLSTNAVAVKIIEGLSARVRKTVDDIKITIKRIR